MSNERVIFLDRDGVINQDRADFVKTPEEWQPISGSLAAIARLYDEGYKVVVITNQSGVGRGLLTRGRIGVQHLRGDGGPSAALEAQAAGQLVGE